MSTQAKVIITLVGILLIFASALSLSQIFILANEIDECNHQCAKLHNQYCLQLVRLTELAYQHEQLEEIVKGMESDIKWIKKDLDGAFESIGELEGYDQELKELQKLISDIQHTYLTVSNYLDDRDTIIKLCEKLRDDLEEVKKRLEAFATYSDLANQYNKLYEKIKNAHARITPLYKWANDVHEWSKTLPCVRGSKNVRLVSNGEKN